MPRLNARALKVTCVLDPSDIAAIGDPPTPRVVLSINVEGCGVTTADIAAKSLRRAQSTIAEHGCNNVACVLQGKLVDGGNKIVEAGLVAQVRVQKPVAAEASA